MRKFINAIIISCLSLQVLGQSPIQKFQGKVNGEVFAITVDEDNDRIYLGGRFSRAGNMASFGAMLNPTSAEVTDIDNQPNSRVNVVTSDGNGGYYIGGTFTFIGDQSRPHIAHLDASGKLTPWAANLNLDGQVEAIYREGNTVFVGGSFDGHRTLLGSRGVLLSPDNDQPGDGTLKVNEKIFAIIPDGAGGYFIGGAFSRIGDQERRGIAHIKADGTLSDWKPVIDGSVHSMALSGDTMYIGGLFTEVGGQPRNNLAALNAHTGALESWNPSADGLVTNMVVINDLVYTAGSFRQLADNDRSALGAIDKNTGVVSDWDPDPAGQVTCLYVSGDRLYVGGLFSNISDHDQHNLVAFSHDGTLLDWNPDPNGQVNAVEVADDLVYIGGSFSQLGDQVRDRIGVVDINTAIPTSWNPGIAGPGANHVNSIKVLDGMVYVGGRFTSVGSLERNYLAEIDPSTGVATSWNPNMSGTVNVVSVSGGTLYAGGSFSGVGGGRHPYFIALDAEEGNVASFNTEIDGPVNTITGANETLYLGGRFGTVQGERRDRLAAINLSSQTVTAWSPDPDNEVENLVAAGDRLYVTGKFSRISEESRKLVAAFDLSDGTITSWDPELLGTHDIVNDLAVWEDQVFVAGRFSRIGGDFKFNLAALDVNTAEALPWDSPIEVSIGGAVSSIAVSENTLYAAGDFRSVGGVQREDLAALSISTGELLDWAPASRVGGSANEISDLALSGGTIYIGGGFDGIGGEERQNVAALELSTGNLTDWNPNVAGNFSNIVFTMEQVGETIYVGGTFSSIGGQSRVGLGAISTVDGKPTDWNPVITGSNLWIEDIAVSGESVFVGGNFATIGGKERAFLASVDVNSGEVSDWAPEPDGSIGSIVVSESQVYVAGGFNNIGGKERGRVAALDITTAQASEWNPVVNGGVFDVVPAENVVYISGTFTEVNGIARNLVAAVNADTGETEDWNVDISSDLHLTWVSSLTLSDNLLYASGTFSGVNGRIQNSIAAFSKTTGEHVSWDPGIRGIVRAVALNQGTLFVGGSNISRPEQRIDPFAGFEAIEKAQNIQFDPLSGKTYGDADFDLSATASSNLDVVFRSSDETVATVSGTTVSIVGAGEVAIIASQPGNAQYLSAEEVSRSFVVGKATLLVEAVDEQRVYGAVNPDFTLAYSGFVNNDDESVLTEPIASTTATESSDTGMYSIELTGGESNKYDFEFTNGTLTIIKADLDAKARDLTVNKGTGDFELKIDYTGFANDDDEAVLDTPPAIMTSGTSESDRGVYEITLSGGDDNNYNIHLTNGTLTLTGPVFSLPTSVDFGITDLNISNSVSLTIQNTGDGALIVTEVSLPTGFSTETESFIVEPGETRELAIIFIPTEPRQYEGQAVFNTNDGQFQVNLNGEGMLVTSIDDGLLNENNLKVFPNPAQTSLIINFETEITGSADISFIDSHGQLKWQVENVVPEELELDISDFAPGVYLLRIEHRGKAITKKVIVKR